MYVKAFGTFRRDQYTLTLICLYQMHWNDSGEFIVPFSLLTDNLCWLFESEVWQLHGKLSLPLYCNVMVLLFLLSIHKNQPFWFLFCCLIDFILRSHFFNIVTPSQVKGYSLSFFAFAFLLLTTIVSITVAHKWMLGVFNSFFSQGESIPTGSFS